MKTVTLYWTPSRKGESPPDYIRCWGMAGEAFNADRTPIGNGYFKFVIPDSERNSSILHILGDKFSTDEPDIKINPKKEVKEKAPEAAPLAAPSRRMNKLDIMDKLSKLNIRYRVNEKPETLFEKLPDDIKANSKLDYS